MSEKVSFCRLCTAGCGIRLQLDNDGKIVSARGDKENPLSKGYACFKGLQAAASHAGSSRLLKPLVRTDDGHLKTLEAEYALDQIASKLKHLLDTYGPQSIGLFTGNGTYTNVNGVQMAKDFMRALGSDQYFSSATLDNSGKMVSGGRLGKWAAGLRAFDDMDVAMIFGANPLLSHGSLGFLKSNPVRNLKRWRQQNKRLIVVDPRNTETARNSDLHLQPRPGQDAAIAGGLIRLILTNGWHDKDFCQHYVGEQRIADLLAAVDGLTPSYVETRAGLEPGQLLTVAEWFARDAKTGSVTSGTGITMQPFSNLAQHLIDCLNVICGRFLREGERLHQQNPVAPLKPVYAEVNPPTRPWERGGDSRLRGARILLEMERCSGTLTDEILTPGEGQIRALFVNGGDPMSSFPDVERTARAMESLELLVCIEPNLSGTAKYADFVLPPFMQYERADLPMMVVGYRNYWPGTWRQYTPPIATPPENSDLVEDWYVFWSLAKRLGLEINYAQRKILSNGSPSTADDLIEILIEGGSVTLEELKQYPSGKFFDLPERVVLPARPESDGRFDPMPEDVGAELCQFMATYPSAAKPHAKDKEKYSWLLSTRRMRDFYNSDGRHVDTIRKRNPYNPAYLNPEDLAKLGISTGDQIILQSAHGRIKARVGEDKHVKPGVVSMAHGWGGNPDEAIDIEQHGSGVNYLIDTNQHFEAINSMPHMSAVPVEILLPQNGD